MERSSSVRFDSKFGTVQAIVGRSPVDVKYRRFVSVLKRREKREERKRPLWNGFSLMSHVIFEEEAYIYEQ
jgi:hypothetical protein